MEESDLADKVIPLYLGLDIICSKASANQKTFFDNLEFDLSSKTKEIENKLKKVQEQLGVKTGPIAKCKSDNDLMDKKIEVKSPIAI